MPHGIRCDTMDYRLHCYEFSDGFMRLADTWKNFLIYFLVDMLYNKDIQLGIFFLCFS